MNLKESVGKEIFLIAEDEIAESEMVVYDNPHDVFTYLSTLMPETDFSTKVYHGMLMPAKVLPSVLHTKNCYVLALRLIHVKGSLTLKGCIFESDCEGRNDILADEIEELVNSKDKVDFEVDIDNIFVLYGYELQVCLAIDEESIDDEVIESCGKVVAEIKKIEGREQQEDAALTVLLSEGE